MTYKPVNGYYCYSLAMKTCLHYLPNIIDKVNKHAICCDVHCNRFPHRINKKFNMIIQEESLTTPNKVLATNNSNNNASPNIKFTPTNNVIKSKKRTNEDIDTGKQTSDEYLNKKSKNTNK